MWEYKRISDNHRDGAHDSLEQLCTIEGRSGWRVIAISDGSQFRFATLERQVNGNNQQTNIGSGLQAVSATTTTGDERPASGAPSDKASTKRQRNTSST